MAHNWDSIDGYYFYLEIGGRRMMAESTVPRREYITIEESGVVRCEVVRTYHVQWLTCVENTSGRTKWVPAPQDLVEDLESYILS